MYTEKGQDPFDTFNRDGAWTSWLENRKKTKNIIVFVEFKTQFYPSFQTEHCQWIMRLSLSRAMNVLLYNVLNAMVGRTWEETWAHRKKKKEWIFNPNERQRENGRKKAKERQKESIPLKMT